MDGDLDEAIAGQAVTLVLDREIDISRGDVLTEPGNVPEYTNQFQAKLVWMNENRAISGRSYLIKVGAQLVPATITAISNKTDVNTLQQSEAKSLDLNEVGTVTFSTDKPIAFDPYADNGTTGGFVVIDRLSNATLAAGTIEFGLHRAQNLTYQDFDVNRKTRSEMKGQTPKIVWFTGLSGSGKSTVANLLEKRMAAEGKHTYILDGDNIRHGLNKDLGFSDEDRVENIRRVAEVAKLMADAGLIVLVSFISPFKNERKLAREVAGDIQFIEAYVNTPLEVCADRDPKGLYAKAKSGEIKNFTGIDSPFEAPEYPDITLNAAEKDPAQLANELYDLVFEGHQYRAL
jgi:bifunctional enzyme CysN/CysC